MALYFADVAKHGFTDDGRRIVNAQNFALCARQVPSLIRCVWRQNHFALRTPFMSTKAPDAQPCPKHLVPTRADAHLSFGLLSGDVSGI